MTDYSRHLLEAFERRSARIGVVGLGYVGLPLVRALHAAGFAVVGFDIDAQKIEKLKRGEGYLKHLGPALFRDLAASNRFSPTDRPADLAGCDAVVLCVPTPLGGHREPDLSFVRDSTRLVADVLRPGMLVSLESTSYPGTTRELCLPILERAASRFGGEVGRDYFVVFSPEREDPGRKDVQTHQIPRLVGGITPHCTRVGVSMYSAAIEHVIAVDSAEVAEAAKLLENIYRAVNIALVNELKTILTPMGIDIWKVIQAASTKPFGFQPFFPGPGLGGHCIPIDPYYLAWKARELGHTTRFIELAGEVNHGMPSYVVSQVAAALNTDAKPLKGSRVLVLGIAYKPDIDDVRETPAAEIIDLLMEAGAEVSYHDPHVAVFPPMRKHSIVLASQPLTEELARASDAVVIVTDHAAIDFGIVARHAKVIVDTRNAMAKCGPVAGRVVKA
ncbi:MAG: UDP-N-acetyl-D-glucosamine 6-dehydrogenase [Phycisphaerales bacterium]|nr:UDP-N-acetyl-D-glucosamine 6-dehydrogenase [Phycisphaerales bacterium]